MTRNLRCEKLDLEQLSKQITNCRKCRLWKGTQNAVPGEGPVNAKVLLVGQNPGEKEDQTGRPFVGRSGKFLDKTLEQNGINREKLFITSIVKHKTPKNRKPKSDEIEACMPYLIQLFEIIEPEIVVLMGKVAWQTPKRSGIEFIKTYHPSSAMRFPKIREKFEEDFLRLGKIIKNNN